jgi:hypothetical protein
MCTYCHRLAKEGGGVAVCKSCDERVCHNVCMCTPQPAGMRVTGWECESFEYSPRSQGDGPTVASPIMAKAIAVDTTESKSSASRLPSVLAMGDVYVAVINAATWLLKSGARRWSCGR